MTHAARASHIGSCLSMTDILAVLYSRVLRFAHQRPDWSDRDRLIVSKGHAAAAVYAVLAECGFFPREWLDSYCRPESPLLGHVSHAVPGVELSTGSLGHGLPVAAGLALMSKRRNLGWRSFVVLGDGELDEGSNWEAALFAAHHSLDTLVGIIDYNKIQSFGHVSEVLGLEPLADKWRAFGWAVQELDGHDIPALEKALATPTPEKPTMIVAHTVKGKGVSFMENQLAWHYKSPNQEQLDAGLAELDVFSTEYRA